MLHRLRSRRSREAGFTLVELLVAMVIIGVLLGIVFAAYLGFRGRAEETAAKHNIRVIVPVIEAYFVDEASYDGMTVAILNRYDAAVNVPDYQLVSASDSTYCIQSTVGLDTWRKNGPDAPIEKAACP